MSRDSRQLCHRIRHCRPDEHHGRTFGVSSIGCGILGCMELRDAVSIADARLVDFVSRHGIRQLALYGSALRPDLGPGSDIDLLVEFVPGRTPGLLGLAAMELELEVVLGYPVELRTCEDLSRYFRDEVVTTSRAVYAPDDDFRLAHLRDAEIQDGDDAGARASR